MPPINSATTGGLPEYARQDVVDSGAGYAPIDPASAQSIDPSQPGFVDPYAYSNGAVPDTYAADPYADPYAASYETYGPEAAYGSAVAGMQPATTAPALPDATLNDFASLGIFTEAELGQLAQMNMSPEAMNALFDEAVAFMQTPEFAHLQAQQQGVGPANQTGMPADPAAAVDPTAAPVNPSTAPMDPAAAGGGEPGWSGEWAVKFRAMMKEQGLDSKTQLMVIASLRQAPLSEAELGQALEYYANTPAGQAELQAANDQVKAGARMQDRLMLSMGAAALGAGALTTAVASSQGNLVKALTRTAAGTGERAAFAARALDDLAANRPLTTAMRAEIAATLRAEAGATSRLRHPLAKASLNGGARHMGEATKLSFREAMKYGLWMKSGDATVDAAAGAASATRATTDAVKATGSTAAKVVAGGGDDVVRAVAGSADDAARAAGGAAQAAMGASRLGTVGRALGPVGLALSAGVGIWGIKKTMEAEGGFGEESAKMTGNVAGGIAGGVAGAAAGAAIGSVVPVIGTGIGAVVGGIVGGIGLGKIGEGVGGFLHGIFD